jgi:SAM-dependent methyltransferase
MAAERLSDRGFMPTWVRHEHLARYEFAAGYVAGKVVVDCACGDGTGSAQYAKAGAAVVHAFDISAADVERAAQRHGTDALRFLPADAGALPFPSTTADLYISLETIEHLNDDRAFLNEVVRVLKPDGLFICSTPNRNITNPGHSISEPPWNPFHVREYDGKEFLTLLSQTFDRVSCFGQNPQGRLSAGGFGLLGRVLPWHGAVRLRQLTKLPRLLYDRLAHHRVKSADWLTECWEYHVAVCEGPKRAILSNAS